MGRTTTSASDSVLQAELEHEQHHVDRVYKRLDELVERASDAERAGRERGQLGYTGEIKEDDYRTLYERDVMVDNAVRRLAVLDAQREGLVFGRLDQAGGVVRYVGRIGIRDEEQEPLVVDWRAPAAAVFYQATPVRPMGVVRRRVLRTRGQQVIGLEDDLLDAEAAEAAGAAGAELVVLGDGALMAALSAARGRQMRDIVSTIQREQDEIIRAPGQGATLISGGPGTGKTVVALHRAAYLLYTDRRRISGGGVLIVGPSGVFMNYIERVLPSLGETEATLRAIGEVMDGVTGEWNDPYDVATVKGSLRMRTVLTRATRDTPPGTPREFRIYLSGRILRLDAGELNTIRHNVLRKSAKPNPARRDAVRGLQNALWRKAGGEESQREEFDADLLDRDEFTEFVDAWWPPLTAAEVFEWLRDKAKLGRYTKGVLRSSESELLARSWAGKSGYSVQDVALLDELHFLLGDPPPPPKVSDPEDIFDEYSAMELRTYADRGQARRVEQAGQYDGYAHVLVDEAQDLSPMQWRMLGRRGARASWTIVGDPAQSSWPDADEASKAQETALGKRPRRAYTLSTNYRNSAEIFELAGGVIQREFPELSLPEAVRRTGVEPSHVVVGSGDGALSDAVVSAVRDLLPVVEGTIGVITTGSRVREVEGWVGRLGPEERGDRVSVLSGLASKGLEYDAVVVVEPSAIAGESPVGVRTLYVVLTRATQRLVTVGSSAGWLGLGEPEPVEAWTEDTLF